jgi:hypothetical protein
MRCLSFVKKERLLGKHLRYIEYHLLKRRNRIIYPKLKLEDFFKFVKDLGLNKIELRNDLPGGKIIDGYTPGQLKELSKKYGVEILTINALQKFNLGEILPEIIIISVPIPLIQLKMIMISPIPD